MVTKGRVHFVFCMWQLKYFSDLSHLYTHTHIRTHTHTHTHTHSQTHTDTHVYTHKYTYTHTDLNFAIFWKDREIKYTILNIMVVCKI